MRARLRFLLRLGVLVSLSACGDDGLGPGRLQGGAWRLLVFQGADGSPVVLPEATFTAEFGEDGRLAVRADCNSCGGTYEASGNSLRVGPLACTRAFCPSAPVDTEYVIALQEARTFEAADRLLSVRGAGGLLVFERNVSE